MNLSQKIISTLLVTLFFSSGCCTRIFSHTEMPTEDAQIFSRVFDNVEGLTVACAEKPGTEMSQCKIEIDPQVSEQVSFQPETKVSYVALVKNADTAQKISEELKLISTDSSKVTEHNNVISYTSPNKEVTIYSSLEDSPKVTFEVSKDFVHNAM